MDAQRDGSAPDDPGRADYRFLLANERTMLAYLRTALALQVAGLGALQFLTQGHDAVRYALGVTLVGLGSFVGVAGYVRSRLNERAIRAGDDIRPSTGGLVVVGLVAVVPLVAAVALAVT
jgi:putative membrane protein